MKKLISLVLALVMVLGLLAACDKAPADDTKAPEQTNAPDDTKAPETTEAPQELEPVVLKWVYDGTEGDGTKDVIEVFNKKLAEVLPNTTLEISFVADYGTNWPMLLAGGENMDLAWVGWKTPMLQDTLDGSFYPLNDLVAEYGPNIKAEMDTWATSYASGSLNGELWMIPCVQPTVTEAQWVGWGSALDPYMDADAFVAEVRANTHLTEKILDLFEEAIQKGIDDGAFVVGSDDWNVNWESLYGMGSWGYKDFPNTDLKYAVEDTELKNLYHQHEIPQAKMVLERVAEWYEKGWITQNSLLGNTPEGSRQLIFTDGGCAYGSNWGMAQDKEKGTYVEQQSEVRADGQNVHYVLINRPEENVQEPTPYGKESTYTVIPYTSQNPERAMMLLNLLHDEPGTPGNDLYNLLCYGFKKGSPEAAEYGWYGYDVVEQDGQNVRTDYTGDMHSMSNWRIGNTYKVLSDGDAMLSVASKENCLSFYEEVYPNLPTNVVSNESIVIDGLTDYKNAVKAVKEEYKALIVGGSCGVANFEDTYTEYIEKLHTAGLDAEIRLIREAIANLK